jgi:hypothetical protein
MHILFDHGTPRGIARSLHGHTVKEAKAQGWDTLSNDDLLRAAEDASFDILLTTDTSLPYHQVILSKNRWSLVRTVIPQIVRAVNEAMPGTCTVVEIPGS